MKPLIYILGLLSGITLCYLFILDSISSEPTPKDESNKLKFLLEENAALTREADSLIVENSALKKNNVELTHQLETFTREQKDRGNANITYHDFDVRNELKEYNTILALSTEQEEQIANWLQNNHWGFEWQRFHPALTDNIKSILSDEQLDVYEKHLAQKADSEAATKATDLLGNYPVTMNLSENQKDIIYSTLYNLVHLDARKNDELIMEIYTLKIDDRNRRMSYDDNLLVWAAKETVSEEQMDALIRSWPAQ